MKHINVRSIRNIPWLLTMNATPGNPIGLLENAAVLIESGSVTWVGSNDSCPQPSTNGLDIDALGLVLMPGLIDCHTHLVFGGDRIDDFYERARGTSYAQIMSRGGGIAHTVANTRLATPVALIKSAQKALSRMLSRGVTTVEVKSGYGLNLDDEIKMLEVIEQLNRMQPLTLVPTFLGAHAVPPEFADRSSDYIDFLIKEVLPQVAKRKLAAAVDIFVERGAFSVEEARRLLVCARSLNFSIKLHADQLSAIGATRLAADLGAMSASHLEHASSQDLLALGTTQVVAELLPLAELYLGVKHVVDVRALISAGVKVAIATDYNPGSSMCDDLQLAMRLAITQRKMTVENALLGVTHHAACALGQQETRGQIKIGMQADLCLFEGASPWTMAYDWTRNPVRQVIKNGELVLEQTL